METSQCKANRSTALQVTNIDRENELNFEWQQYKRECTGMLFLIFFASKDVYLLLSSFSPLILPNLQFLLRDNIDIPLST